jgi:hypothetical protein
MNSSFFNNGNPPSNEQRGKNMQLTNDDLAALVTEFRGVVDDLLAKPTRYFPTFLLVVGEDGKRMQIELQTDDLNHRDRKPAVMHRAAQAVARQGIVPAAVVMVSGARIAPKEEGIMVGVTAADYRTMAAIRRIERDAQDNLAGKDWLPVVSARSPLLEEFYFGYDAAVIGGGCSNHCLAFDKEDFQKSLKEYLGDDQPRFILPAEENGAVNVANTKSWGKCMEVIWVQPGLSEEEQRLFDHDMSEYWGHMKGCLLSVEEFADHVAQATKAGAVDGVAIWVPRERKYLMFGRVSPGSEVQRSTNHFSAPAERGRNEPCND